MPISASETPEYINPFHSIGRSELRRYRGPLSDLFLIGRENSLAGFVTVVARVVAYDPDRPS